MSATILNTRPQRTLCCKPFHEWVFPDGRLWTLFYRVKSGYLLRFPELADFAVSASGLTVDAYPVPGVSHQTVQHLYLNQVLPLALSRRFKLVLHGSAVEVDNTAIAFLGKSGRGKSTIAASFSTNGFRFLTDDGLQLDLSENCFFARPSHPSIRLWDDSREALIPESTCTAQQIDYTKKARLLADDQVVFCDQVRALGRVYFLGESDTDTISIVAVRGRDAMIEMVRHSFLLDIDERKMLTHHFEQLLLLAKHPIFFRLDYPRRYEMLRQVHESVVKHVRTPLLPSICANAAIQ